jgi:SecD/SecF fusion protein
LGQESINKGVTSFVIAFFLVLVYIFFYYNLAGLASIVALLANVFFIIGALASLGTTLTLPGIAGLVLTIGMSVDANVIIFERIKEELADGKGIRLAITDGFNKSLSAILDANVTTLLTAIILMVFGEGPVKGFAVVLFVGIIFSFFTAIFITRMLFEARLNAKKEIRFSIPLTANAFKNTNIQFLKNRKKYYIISGIVIALGIVSFATKSFNLGVDLKGGRSYTISFDNTNISTSDIAASLESALGSSPTVKFFGSNDKVKIITKYKFDEASEEVDLEVKKLLFDNLSAKYTSAITFEQFIDKDYDLGISESYIVGPTIAKDIKTKSIYAIIFSLIVMFLYIMIRFKGWQFAAGAIVALIHDVIVVLAMFSIFDGILPFSLEIDQAIIAAVLTVIGYSINDTVIVFDRIREFLGENKKKDQIEVMNNALNSTLSRTVNTSTTTIFVLLVIFLFGGAAIKGMSFALLVGILVGTYSSLCIASSVVADVTKKKVIKA